MHLKRLAVFSIFFYLLSVCAHAESLSLDALLAQAREHNPELIAARQAWKVKQSEIGPSGTWPDPTFTFADEKFPSGTAGAPDEKIRHYRIEQPIPFPGKLSEDSRMKHHETLIAEAEYRTKALEIEQAIRMRFYQLYLTEQKIELSQQSVLLLKNALSTAQGRVAANQTSALDIFMLQTELGQMQNDLFTQTQERTLIQIALNTLLDQPTETVLGNAQPPTLKAIPVALAELQRLARANSPAYQAAMHEINHSRAMLERQRLAFAPDFGVMYERETTPSGPDGRQIGFSVTFPLWFTRPWAELHGAREHLLEASANAQTMQNMTLENVSEEYTEVQTHLTLAQRYESDILPSARSSLTIAQQQYASGQTDFMRLLEAFRAWIGAHNDYQEQMYHYGEHWSELSRWVGVDLEQANEALAHDAMPMEMTHEDAH